MVDVVLEPIVVEEALPVDESKESMGFGEVLELTTEEEPPLVTEFEEPTGFGEVPVFAT